MELTQKQILWVVREGWKQRGQPRHSTYSCFPLVHPLNTDLILKTYRCSSTLGETSLDHSLYHVLHNLLVGLLLGSHQDSLTLLWSQLVDLVFHGGRKWILLQRVERVVVPSHLLASKHIQRSGHLRSEVLSCRLVDLTYR